MTFDDWKQGGAVPKGWDCADAIDDGWSSSDIVEFMRATVRPWTPPEPPPEREPVPEPEPQPEPQSLSEDERPFAPDEAYDLRDDFGAYDESGELIEVSRESLKRDMPEMAPRPDGVEVWGGEIETLRKWVFLTKDDKFCHAETGDLMGRGAFDLAHGPITPLVQTENAKGEQKVNKFPATKTLVEYLDGFICSSTLYRPDVDALQVWSSGICYLNSYLPASVPVASDDWEAGSAWRVVRDHIHNILPDGAEKIIEWIAHNVQHPGRKILWAPIIIGVPGDGKTTIGKVLQASMGAVNVRPVQRDSLNSDFTDWAEGAAVRIFEEIHVDGRDAGQMMDKIKPYITNDVISYVGKGRPAREIANVTNYAGFSNHQNALPVDDNDRRWAAWETRFKSRAAMKAELGADYWETLHSAIDAGAAELRGWLLNVDLSRFSRFDPPEMTDAKRQMIELTRAPIFGDVEEAIELGGFGIGQTVFATDCLSNRLKEVSGRSVSTTVLSKVLDSLGWAKLERTMSWRGKTRRIYHLRSGFAGSDEMSLQDDVRLALDRTDDGSGQGENYGGW